MQVQPQEVGDRLIALRKMYPGQKLSTLADKISEEISGLVPVPYSNGSTAPIDEKQLELIVGA